MEISLSPRQQAIFAQRKLLDIYNKTCLWFASYREVFLGLEEIVLWRKPVLTFILYLSVHFLFWRLYTVNSNFITTLSDIIFWVLLADGFWVVATRDKTQDLSSRNQSSSSWSNRLSRVRRNQKQLQFMSMEEALIKDGSPLKVGELAPYEVICLWISKVIMWADNVQLALRHWNLEQPYVFAFVTGTVGLGCIPIGYFISGFFLLYVVVMSLLVYPVLLYYDLVSRTVVAMETNYPILVDRFVRTYNRMKSMLKRLPEGEFIDYLLQDDSSVSVPETGTEPDPESETQNLPESPSYNRDVSMSLPPFDPNVNPLDSMVSFTPPPEGFPSIRSYFKEDSNSVPSSQSHPLAFFQKGPDLGTISESSETQDNFSTDEIQSYEWDQPNTIPSQSSEQFENPSLSEIRQRSITLTLDPFKSDDNPLRDSFDEELYESTKQSESQSSTVPDISHGLNPDSNDSGLSTTDTDPSPVPSAPLEPPPPYPGMSPYFMQQYGSPSLQGFQNYVPTNTSTPSEEDRTNNGTLRQRDVKND